MPTKASSSASLTPSKNGKTQESRTRSEVMPISTIGQGQALLLAQATPPAQTDERVTREGEDTSLAEKGRSRPSMRAALSSIKDKAKRLSFSSSASGKDDATLASTSGKDDVTLVDKEEHEKRENEKREAENKAFGLGKKGLGKGGVQMGE